MKIKNITTSLTRSSSWAYIDEYFEDNRHGWEITEKDTETSAIMNGTFWMINKTESQWNYYHNSCLSLEGTTWKIEANLACVPGDQHNQLGLVWGFDEAPEILNRFAISADGKNATVLCFERQHRRVFHRFHTSIKNIDTSAGFKLSVLRNGNYYYFMINNQLIYLCHEKHFIHSGNRFGFYVEPQLRVSCNHICCGQLELTEKLRLKDQLLLL